MASVDVKIPPMGESISSGVLAKWHVADGDTVKAGQALFELETDKITSEGTAEADGRISLKVEEGAEVKIGEVVATIEPGAIEAAPSPDTEPGDKGDAAREERPAAKAASLPPPSPAALEGLSPAVRRLATESGIDPSQIEGTGKAGRVTKGDLLKAAEGKPEAEEPKRAAGPAPAPPEARKPKAKEAPAESKQTRKKMSPLRARIAERLVQAQREAAMLTTFNEVDLSSVMALRSRHQEAFVKKHGIKLGFMSFFAKAVVHALKEVPALNTQIDGDSIVQNHYYDLGVAVSTDKGLMVPVVRDCDTLGMAGIEQAIVELAKKARDGKIALADLEGGVFTITNGGIFGSMLSTPILNAPQSGILGLHAINQRAVAVEGQVVIRPMMYLALSYDHRIVDGRDAVTFLVRVKQAIEDPARLLIDL